MPRRSTPRKARESAAARFRRADRAEGNGSVACADVFPGNREDVCKEAGSIVMQERAGAKAMDMTSGEKTSRAPRNAQIDSEKARLRKKPPRSPSLPRRYVSAASPFCFAFHTDIALRRMPVPFFHDAGNNAPSKARFNRYSRCNLRSPDRTARQRSALSRRPRGRTGVFYRRFMEKAKAASTASAPPAVRRRPARCASARRAVARRRCFCNLVRSSRKRLKRLLA